MQAGGLPALHLRLSNAATGCLGALGGRDPLGQAFGQLGLRFAGGGQRWQGVGLVGQNGFDHPVQQQVRVAANGAGEVGIGLIRQAKVANIFRGVHSLHHRAQQHGVHLQRIWAVVRGFGDCLKFSSGGMVADTGRDGQGFQVSPQNFYLLDGWFFVHSKQRQTLVVQDEITGAHVGCQHALFNQPVRLGALAWHNFFDSPRLVADDFRLHRVKVHGTARFAGFEQGAVHPVQIQEVWD